MERLISLIDTTELFYQRMCLNEIERIISELEHYLDKMDYLKPKIEQLLSKLYAQVNELHIIQEQEDNHDQT